MATRTIALAPLTTRTAITALDGEVIAVVIVDGIASASLLVVVVGTHGDVSPLVSRIDARGPEEGPSGSVRGVPGVPI